MFRAVKYCALLSMIFVLGLSAVARADSPEPASSSAPVEPASTKESTQSWLVSEPRQIDHWLDGKGITPSLTLINDWSKNFTGGSSTVGTFDRYSLDVALTLDDARVTRRIGYR